MTYGVFNLRGDLFMTKPNKLDAYRWGSRWMKVLYVVRPSQGKFDG